MTSPVERLEQWCDEAERKYNEADQRDLWHTGRPEQRRTLTAYRRLIADYRSEQEWGNIQKQLHACGGNKEAARQAANRAMYTADGLHKAITRLADELRAEPK